MFSPPYFSNATNFESAGIRELLELLCGEVDKLTHTHELQKVRLVEMRLPSATFGPFEAHHIRLRKTLKIFLPRPGDIKTSPLVQLADALSGEASDQTLSGGGLQHYRKLVNSICNALGDTAYSCAHKLTLEIAPKVDLRFRQQITKEERARNSMPSVNYQISCLEAEAIQIQSKINRQEAKLAKLKADAGEED